MSNMEAWAITGIILLAMVVYHGWRWYADRKFFEGVDAAMRRLEQMRADYEAEGRALKQAASAPAEKGERS